MKTARHWISGLLLCLAGCAVSQPKRWIESWAPPQQLVEPKNQPPLGLSHATIRQVIHPTLGGSRAVLHFSNVFGDQSLTIQSCHVAAYVGSGRIDPATDHTIQFAGQSGVILPPGTEVLSDPIDTIVQPHVDLSVTIQFGNVPKALTGHPGSRTTSYLSADSDPAAVELPSVSTTQHWYVLSGLDTLPIKCRGGLIVLGDSIADGRGSDTDKNNRWPDDLARRLPEMAVVNSGIGGNRLVSDGLGPSALSRFDRDIATAAGAKWLIISEGVNDIGTSSGTDAKNIADTVIHAYQQLISRAHRLGLKVYGTTLLPFGGSFYDTPIHQTARQTVNDWVRAPKHFDAVIDFDALLRDPTIHTKLQAQYETGDHLHPNPAGYQRIADSVDTSIFSN